MRVWSAVLFAGVMIGCAAESHDAGAGDTEQSQDDRVAECTEIHGCIEMRCGDEWQAYKGKEDPEAHDDSEALRAGLVACVEDCAGYPYEGCVPPEGESDCDVETMPVENLALTTYRVCDYGFPDCDDYQAACFGS